MNYKLSSKINDTVFNIDNIDNYDFTIAISDKTLKLCVTDITSMRCLLFEEYLLKPGIIDTDLINIIEDILDKNSYLQAAFWRKIRILIDSPLHTLVPEKFFDVESAKQVLMTIGEVNDNVEIFHDHLPCCNTYQIYSISKPIKEYLHKKYGEKIVFYHKTSLFLEGIFKHLADHATHDGKHSNIIVVKGVLFLTLFNGSNLIFSNQIKTKNSEELAKTVLRTFKIYGLNAQSPLRIWGDLKENSNVIRFFEKHLKNVSNIPDRCDLVFVEDNSSLASSSHLEIYNSFHIN